MKAREYHGIIPPLLTAFTREGEIDEKATRAIVRFVLPHVHGLYPVGTYGSGPLMTVAEREKVLEIILDEVAGRVPVVAHVGAPSARVAIELARHAKKAGASGVGAISPYYAPNLPEDNLFDYFLRILEAVDEREFPFFVYNNSHYSQNSVTPRLLARLAERGLRGLKDSSFDIVSFYLFQDAVSAYPDFNVIIGTEAVFVAAFDAGAIGTVCGMGNIFPEVMAQIYDAHNRADRVRAIELQRLILKIRAVTKLGPTIPIMHEILRLRGIEGGFSRSPYIPVTPELGARIRRELKELKLV